MNMKCIKCKTNNIWDPHNSNRAKLCLDCKTSRNSTPRVSNCAICGVKIVSNNPGNLKIICDLCRKKYMWTGKRYLQGLDFIREIRRVIGNHTCELCGKKWEKGTRRFDIHHPDDYGKSTHKYEKIDAILKTMVLCHKDHLNLSETKESMRLARLARCG